MSQRLPRAPPCAVEASQHLARASPSTGEAAQNRHTMQRQIYPTLHCLESMQRQMYKLSRNIFPLLHFIHEMQRRMNASSHCCELCFDISKNCTAAPLQCLLSLMHCLMSLCCSDDLQRMCLVLCKQHRSLSITCCNWSVRCHNALLFRCKIEYHGDMSPWRWRNECGRRYEAWPFCHKIPAR